MRELIETAAADKEVGHTRKGKEKPSTNTASGLRKKIKKNYFYNGEFDPGSG